MTNTASDIRKWNSAPSFCRREIKDYLNQVLEEVARFKKAVER
jgi:hypothetical protein